MALPWHIEDPKGVSRSWQLKTWRISSCTSTTSCTAWAPTSLRKHVVGGWRAWEHTDTPGELPSSNVGQAWAKNHPAQLNGRRFGWLACWVICPSIPPAWMSPVSPGMNSLEGKDPNIIYSAWWFGTWMDYDFPIILGISSSQLTNSYFSEG